MNLRMTILNKEKKGTIVEFLGGRLEA